MILGGAKYTTSNNQGPSYVFEVRGAKKIFVGSFEDFFQNMAKGPVKFPKLKGGRSPWPYSPTLALAIIEVLKIGFVFLWV